MRATRRPRWRLVLDCALAGAGIGVAAWRLAPTLAAVHDLAGKLANLHWTWLGLAIVAAVAALTVYAALHRQLLASAGAPLPFPTVLAVNFIGNAIAQTLPSAGAAAGTAYLAAALRHRGVDTALSVWSAALAALLSGSTLVVIGPLVLVFDGLVALPVGAALSGLLALLLWATWLVVRRPQSLRWIVRHSLAVARHLPVLRRSRWVTVEAATASTAITDRMARLRLRPAQSTGLVGIALLSWGLDFGGLAACVAATGSAVPWPALAVGYLAVQASIGLQLTPAGTGPAEAGLLAVLIGGGVPAGWAAVAVVLYRAITWLGLTSAGWAVFLAVARNRAELSPK